MATILGTITGFVRTIATRQLVMRDSVVGQQNADIADTV